MVHAQNTASTSKNSFREFLSEMFGCLIVLRFIYVILNDFVFRENYQKLLKEKRTSLIFLSIVVHK